MSTKKGLKPFTSETGAEAGRKGGIASGESRRRKKTIRQALEALLSCRNPNNGLEGVEEMALAIFETVFNNDIEIVTQATDGQGVANDLDKVWRSQTFQSDSAFGY